jgi:hypothetical protein
MAGCSVILDFGMKLIDVISQTEQKNLQFYPGFPTEQKSLESIVVFQNSKCPFNLDGTVHPVLDPRFAYDIFIRFPAAFNKVF